MEAGTGLAEKMEEVAVENQGAQLGWTGSSTNSSTNNGAGAPADGIRAFDENGRQLIVPREEWRANVIPGMVREAWENPDQLYVVILNSLNDGFAAEMTEPAKQLYEIDPIAGRGAYMWGIVLMQTGRMVEAEEVLAGFGATHGEDGSVLVNLAKVYAQKGDMELARTTLARALEVEPNHDNGLGWYASMEQERGGDEAARALLERLATIPTSWRAQLWLARGELNGGNLAAARALYEDALQRAPRPLPPDFLMQMSGDLGGHGHLGELIELTAPNFVAEWHGMPVGNNLIKALVDTGRLDEADAVKAALQAQNRPDWQEALAFWDGEIGRRRGATAAVPPQELQVGMLRIDGPVWLPPGSPAQRLFGVKSAGAPKVTFLGGSAEAPDLSHRSREEQALASDGLGRLTRALPLYFAEQTEMRTAAAGRAMVPWAVAPVSGFVVSGQMWRDETAVQAVSAAENASEYVVSVHVDAEVEPWTAMLAFVRTSDGTRIGELEAEFSPDEPEAGLAQLADEVVELLSALGPERQIPAYQVPNGPMFTAYLIRLEQLLAVRCASMDGVPAEFLSGEQQILEGELELCRAQPESVPARLLLHATFGAIGKLRPESARQFAPKLEQLRREHPLAAVDSLAV